jgi:antitoxin component of RelBE/YafQ-DinJ toxin-antitoxin module
MARTKMLFIRVSDEEKAEAKAIAKAEGLTMSAYLRRCVILASRKSTKRQAA